MRVVYSHRFESKFKRTSRKLDRNLFIYKYTRNRSILQQCAHKTLNIALCYFFSSLIKYCLDYARNLHSTILKQNAFTLNVTGLPWSNNAYDVPQLILRLGNYSTRMMEVGRFVVCANANFL